MRLLFSRIAPGSLSFLPRPFCAVPCFRRRTIRIESCLWSQRPLKFFLDWRQGSCYNVAIFFKCDEGEKAISKPVSESRRVVRGGTAGIASLAPEQPC